jgi:hypothetical protein
MGNRRSDWELVRPVRHGARAGTWHGGEDFQASRGARRPREGARDLGRRAVRMPRAVGARTRGRRATRRAGGMALAFNISVCPCSTVFSAKFFN